MDDLDRWTRVLPLGSGAFGEVHLAWDTQSSEWVALKRFTGQDELGLLRFVIESRIRVSHPHLVRTLAFRLVDDRAWLVTQLARGGSVRALMARTGALPWGWVAELVDQVLSALVTLHSTGVVHRDLKPANLLLRDGGGQPHLLVGDFGIATWRTVSMTGVGAAIGTPGYLAPEYLDGQQPSPAIDVFALGVLAAELLAGARLVHYSNATPVLPSTWNDTLPVPDGVPAQLTAVLRRMADPDPRRRYVDCAQAREALLAACPPGSRGDLAAVRVPDLLASLPPGWTAAGPDPTSVTEVPAMVGNGQENGRPADSLSEPPYVGPGWASPPIDGGPTSLVDQSAAPTANTPLAPATPATPPATPAGGSATSPATPPRGSAAAGNGVKPEKAAAKVVRKARRRRKLKRATIIVVALAVLGAAGTLWWAAGNRGIAGQPSPTGVPTGEAPADWEPVVIEACQRVDIDRYREGDTERCQRTQGTESDQSWVAAPPGGFPVSDTAGPFPGEDCTNEKSAYSPTGESVRCVDGTWELVG